MVPSQIGVLEVVGEEEGAPLSTRILIPFYPFVERVR